MFFHFTVLQISKIDVDHQKECPTQLVMGSPVWKMELPAHLWVLKLAPFIFYHYMGVTQYSTSL